MSEVIKKSYFALLSKIGLSTLFWIVTLLATFNLGYSYTLSLKVAALQGRTQTLELKVQLYENVVSMHRDAKLQDDVNIPDVVIDNSSAPVQLPSTQQDK